jgi:hypothetical protein
MDRDRSQDSGVRSRKGFVLPDRKEDWPVWCSSLRSCPCPSDYCFSCSHADWPGSGTDRAGKEWRWTFNPQFGPLFLGKRGQELARQPGEGSAAWPLFELWMGKFERTKKEQAEECAANEDKRSE